METSLETVKPIPISLGAPKQAPAWRRATRSLLRAGWPLLAIIILLIVTLTAAFGPQIAPRDPNRQNLIARLKPPYEVDRRGQILYPLGTDALGRDILSRLIYGARVSLAVGVAAVILGGTLGTL